MNKEKLIQEFERLRRYHGEDMPVYTLRLKIEKTLRGNYKDKTIFDKYLKQYLNNIYKLKAWHRLSRKNQ